MTTTRNYPSRKSLNVFKEQTISGVPSKSMQSSFIVTNGSVFYGDNVKGWRQKIARGQSATTALHGTRYLVKGTGDGVYTYQATASPSVNNGVAYGDLLLGNGQFVTFATTSTSLDVATDDKARSKLLGSIINAKNTWRGGNFLAEIAETIHFLRHPLQSFYQRTWDFAGVVKRLGKVNKLRPIQYGKDVGSAYLAYVFGVKPLVDDINDATKAVNEQLGFYRFDSKPVRGVGVTKVVTDSRSSFNPPSGFPAPPASYSFPYKVQIGSKVRYKGAIKATPSSGYQQLETLGVGFYDILPAVWEAIPWSFFIDYFANVGEQIDALRYAAVDVAWGMREYRNTGTKQFQDLFFQGVSGGYTVSLSAGKAWTQGIYVDRVSSNLPYPSWQFRIPGIGSMKWLNIDALALQCFGSKPPDVRPNLNFKGPGQNFGPSEIGKLIRTAGKKRRKP
jgi:hypothetical protein